MFKHSIAASTMMLTLTLGSSTVFANPSLSNQDHSGSVIAQAGESPRREKKKKDFFEQLNLSEQQKQQISTIRQKYRGNIDETSKRLRTTQRELQQLMSSDASKDSIRGKHQQVGNLRQEMEKLRFESMLEIRDVLTTAQRKELEQMMQQRRQRTPDRPGDRPKPPAAL